MIGDCWGSWAQKLGEPSVTILVVAWRNDAVRNWGAHEGRKTSVVEFEKDGASEAPSLKLVVV